MATIFTINSPAVNLDLFVILRQLGNLQEVDSKTPYKFLEDNLKILFFCVLLPTLKKKNNGNGT
jgi:hypothetical protein